METNNEYWGLSTHINLYACDKALISSAEQIKNYVIELCDRIEVKRYGDPMLVHFGERDEIAGYSLVQLIETSSITGHFVDHNGDAYIDVFSCKFYNAEEVVAFTKTFFSASEVVFDVIKRK